MPKLKPREGVTCLRSQKKKKKADQNLNLGRLTLENKRTHVPGRLEMKINESLFEHLRQEKKNLNHPCCQNILVILQIGIYFFIICDFKLVKTTGYHLPTPPHTQALSPSPLRRSQAGFCI